MRNPWQLNPAQPNSARFKWAEQNPTQTRSDSLEQLDPDTTEVHFLTQKVWAEANFCVRKRPQIWVRNWPKKRGQKMNTHVQSCAPAHTEAKAWSFSDPNFGSETDPKIVTTFELKTCPRVGHFYSTTALSCAWRATRKLLSRLALSSPDLSCIEMDLRFDVLWRAGLARPHVFTFHANIVCQLQCAAQRFNTSADSEAWPRHARTRTLNVRKWMFLCKVYVNCLRHKGVPK